MLSFLFIACAAFILTRLVRPRHRVEFALVFAAILPTIILLIGYLLSALRLIARAEWWTIAGGGVLAVVLLPVLLRPAWRTRYLRKPTSPRDLVTRVAAAHYRRFDTRLLLALGVTALVVTLTNLRIAVMLRPSNLDALEYHLARIAYYLQQGHLGYYEPNFWAQVVHPKVSTVLMLYTYVVTGDDCLTQLVQLSGYLVSMLAIYGIARQLGAARRGSAFAGLIFGLLTICYAEAPTAQNDLTLTAFVGVLIYSLLAYRETRRPAYLLLAALAFAMGAGVKATFATALPSVLLVAMPVFRPWKAVPRRHLALGVAGGLLAVALITLPAGYWDNLRHFNHPLGPKQVRQLHAFDGLDAGSILGYGSKNLLRYAFDFLQLDGLGHVPGIRGAQQALQALPRAVTEGLDLRLDSTEDTRGAFSYRQSLYTSDNCSYWGVLGILLVWPVVILALCGVPRAPYARLFALAAIVFYVVQAYSSPYDLWRGRYFITAALFAVIPLAFLSLAPRVWYGKAYLVLVVALGCASALCGSFVRGNEVQLRIFSKGSRFLYPFAPEQIPQLTRLKQFVRDDPGMYIPLARFEGLVPPDAVVAVDVSRPQPEYLFFGEGLTRRLIPLHPFWDRRLPIPPEADYLLCSADSPYHQPDDETIAKNDIIFGALFLRKLR